MLSSKTFRFLYELSIAIHNGIMGLAGCWILEAIVDASKLSGRGGRGGRLPPGKMLKCKVHAASHPCSRAASSASAVLLLRSSSFTLTIRLFSFSISMVVIAMS